MTDLSKKTNMDLDYILEKAWDEADDHRFVAAKDELARRLAEAEARAEAAEAVVAKYREAFTSLDGVLLVPGGEAWYADGHLHFVMDDDGNPDEDGNYVVPGDPEQVGVGACVPYSYEDTVVASECFSTKDAAMAWLSEEAKRQNAEYAAEAAEAARNAKEAERE